MRPRIALLFVWVLGLFLLGCSSEPETTRSSSPALVGPVAAGTNETEEDDDFFIDDYGDDAPVNDPLEPFNRVMFGFNDFVITYAFKPLGTAYGAVMPDPVETGISNFFDNIAFPVRFTNQVLQGKFGAAGRETQKFLLNSTVGIAGLMKPSDQYESLNPASEDLGQTLGHWGFGNGPYIVLPFLGASTLRDTVGFAGDRFLSPTQYYPEEDHIRRWVEGGERLNSLPGLVEEYENFTEAALDPYSSLRDGYLKFRARKVQE